LTTSDQAPGFSPALHPQSGNDQSQPEKEKEGCQDINQNPHVGIAAGKEQFRGEQEQAGKYAAGRNHDPTQTEPVLEQALGLAWCFFFWHKELFGA
jgi:hypothetical protein